MAKPTESQVRALEKAHKQALANLLQAIRFRFYIYNKLGKDSPEWKKYAQLVFDIGTSWYKRQMELEKGGATKEGILPNDLFTSEGNKKLRELVKKWDANGQGIGIVPLIIWAFVAIVGFFSADYIVDELNTTTEEQESLIRTSEEICKTHNFNDAECKAFITQQTEAVNPPGGGMGSTLVKWGVGLGVAYLLFTQFQKHQASKKT